MNITNDELQKDVKKLREALASMVSRHIIYCGGPEMSFAGETDKKLMNLAIIALQETDRHDS